MEITLPVILGYAGTIFTAIGGWFTMKFTIERANEKIIELQRQVNAQWKSLNDHEKDSAEIRERFNKDISRLEGSQLVHTEQFKQILSILEEIKKRMDSIERR